MLLAVDESKVQLDLRQQGVDSLVILGVLASTQGIQADGAEHGTGIHIDVAHLCGQPPRQGGFACPRRAVDCN